MGRRFEDCLLKDAGLPAKTRSVIAALGAVPAPPSWSYTKVVPVARVEGLVRGAQLTAGQVERVADFLWQSRGRR